MSSQESDIFPDTKDCMDDPQIQNVINSVQGENPFPIGHSEDFVDYSSINGNPENSGLGMMFADPVMIQAPMPSPTCTMLCTDQYAGPFDFEVHVNGENSSRDWLFSCQFNKLYITMNTVIHLSFKCNSFPPGLYVRAILVFSESKDFQRPVYQCVFHRFLANKHNDGIPENMHGHIIVIEHPEAVYDYNETSQRRSVRLLLNSPQAGSDSVIIPYKFTCKNSCFSGINKVPVEIIFTLEDYQANVYGRQKMKVKICCSPKRDKTKEERNAEPREASVSPARKQLMCPKSESGAGKRKMDEMFQIPVLHMEDYLVSLYLTCSWLKIRLRMQKREPTEKESQLLAFYEQELRTYEEMVLKKKKRI